MDWTRGRTIGRGSSATVSLATATAYSGDIFAVKSAELSNSQLLQREQQILSSLTSPYIVEYSGYDVTLEQNKEFYNLFMEYAGGGSVWDTIKDRGGRLEESTILHFTRQILRGLDYLHSNGIAHCDIKGRNVLVFRGGAAKIGDFGCAKRLNSEPIGADYATNQRNKAEFRSDFSAAPISGTPAFMAPEVVRGEIQNFASDIWSLGCTVIEMATGSPPWRNGSDLISVLYQIGFSDELPEIPKLLSAGAKDFLEKCLRRDPIERWSAGGLLKHPWIAEFHDCEECCCSSSSPTSILELGIWNFLEGSGDLENLSRSSFDDSVKERIRQLSSISAGARWGDENGGWITIRESNGCDLKEGESHLLLSGSKNNKGDKIRKSRDKFDFQLSSPSTLTFLAA